jgi:hypothetical protein
LLIKENIEFFDRIFAVINVLFLPFSYSGFLVSPTTESEWVSRAGAMDGNENSIEEFLKCPIGMYLAQAQWVVSGPSVCPFL